MKFHSKHRQRTTSDESSAHISFPCWRRKEQKRRVLTYDVEVAWSDGLTTQSPESVFAPKRIRMIRSGRQKDYWRYLMKNISDCQWWIYGNSKTIILAGPMNIQNERKQNSRLELIYSLDVPPYCHPVRPTDWRIKSTDRRVGSPCLDFVKTHSRRGSFPSGDDGLSVSAIVFIESPRVISVTMIFYFSS